MPVAVTGSAGFLGRAVVRHLVERGHDVIGIDRRGGHGSGPAVLTADLLDGDPDVVAALASADAVLHLAGCPGVRDNGPQVSLRRQRDNVDATAFVASVVPRAVPLVVTSSSSVYGGTVSGRACVETDELDPRGGYARSKVQTEAECARRASEGGHVLVVRPFTVVGEGQRPDMALHRWAVAIRGGRPVRIFGSIDRTRDLTCVREVARGLVDLVERQPTGVVNLGSGRPRSLREIVAAVEHAVGDCADLHIEPADTCEVPDTLACTQRFEALTGFVPATDLDDAVARVVADLPSAVAPDAVRPEEMYAVDVPTPALAG